VLKENTNSGVNERNAEKIKLKLTTENRLIKQAKKLDRPKRTLRKK